MSLQTPRERAEAELARCVQKLRLVRALKESDPFNSYFVARLKGRRDQLSEIALRATTPAEREEARLCFLEVDRILQWVDADERGYADRITELQMRQAQESRGPGA